MEAWKNVTQNLYTGVMIQTICGIAATVFGAISLISKASDLASGNWGGATSMGFSDYLIIAANIGAIYGFWLFFSNLNPWKQLVGDEDAKTIGKIYTATILQMVAIVLRIIPFVGLIGGILNFVAWIMLLIAYSNLKNSSTFPATEGAGKIFTAMILTLVGTIIAIIPVIGIIGSIINICAFFMTLKGWKLIASSEKA